MLDKSWPTPAMLNVISDFGVINLPTLSSLFEKLSRSKVGPIAHRVESTPTGVSSPVYLVASLFTF